MIIPPNTPLRVVGDVHGDSRAFSFAADTDRFVIQLGDLTDSGPDSAGALAMALRLVEEGRGVFLLGGLCVGGAAVPMAVLAEVANDIGTPAVRARRPGFPSCMIRSAGEET